MSHNQQIEINMRGHKIRELELEILRLTALLRECEEAISAVATSLQREDAIIPKVVHCLVCKGLVSNSNGFPQHRPGCFKEKAQLLLDKLTEFKEKP